MTTTNITITNTARSQGYYVQWDKAETSYDTSVTPAKEIFTKVSVSKMVCDGAAGLYPVLAEASVDIYNLIQRFP